MKKITGLFFAILGISLFFVGCASTPVYLDENSPIAIITIAGNSSVPWEAENPDDPDEADADGLLSSLVNKLIDGENPEILTAVDRLDYADEAFRSVLSEVAGCEFIEKDKLLSSAQYKKIRPTYFNILTSTKIATGYKDLSVIGAKNARLLMKDVGATSLISATFTFEKKLLNGNRFNGTCAGNVKMQVKLINSRGKEIINREYTAITSEKTTIAHHKYDKDAFVETLAEAIENVIRQFAIDYMSDRAAETEKIEESGEKMAGTPIKLPVPKKTPKNDNATGGTEEAKLSANATESEAQNSSEQKSTENAAQ